MELPQHFNTLRLAEVSIDVASVACLEARTSGNSRSICSVLAVPVQILY